MYCSIFLDAQGGVYTCGSNVSGALGLGDFVSQGFPAKIMEFGKSRISLFVCGETNVILSDHAART